MKLLGVKKRPKGRQQALVLAHSSEESIEQRPVDLEIGGVHLRFDKGSWESEGVVTDRKLALKALALENELTKLKDDYQQLQDENVKAKESQNLMDFKFQLLIDMWTMRVLDNDQEEFAQGLEASNKSGNLMLQAEPSAKPAPPIEAGDAQNRVQPSQSEDIVAETPRSQSAYSEVEPFPAAEKERGKEIYNNKNRSENSGKMSISQGDESMERIDAGNKNPAYDELDDIEYSDGSFEGEYAVEDIEESAD